MKTFQGWCQEIGEEPTPYQAWQAATLAERERCAKVAEVLYESQRSSQLVDALRASQELAAAIRGQDAQ